MKRSRIVSLVLLCAAALAVMAVVGCNQAPKEVTIGLLNATGMAWANTAALMQGQIDAYNKETGSKLKIESTLVPYANLHEKMLTEFVGKTGAYDMVSVVGDWMAEFIKGGFLTPFDDYLKKDPPEGYPAQFPPALMEMQTGPDKKIYGLPFHDGPIMFYWRTDVLADPNNQAAFKKKYGYDLARPVTWQQFLDQAQFFTKKGSMWGTMVAAKQGSQQLTYDFYILLFNFGGKIFDDTWHPVFNSPEGVQALQFYVDLIDKYKVVDPAVTTFDVPDKQAPMMEGRVAMDWDWSHIAMYAAQPDKSKIVGKLDFGTMPVLKEGMTPYTFDDYWVWTIPSSSKNKDVVYKFIKWQVSKKNDALTYSTGQGIGVRYDNYRDPDLLKQFPYMAGIDKALSVNYFTPPKIPEFAKVNDAIGLECSNAIAGKKSVKQALDDAFKAVDEVMKQAGYYK